MTRTWDPPAVNSLSVAAPHRVIWLSPSPPSPPAESSTERVAAVLSEKAQIASKNLEAWNPELPAAYSLVTEVDGVRRFAAETDWSSYHLVGFSAAATVVLAAALQKELLIRSATVIEPATIGDDDWSETEAAWRLRIEEIFALPPGPHQKAFAEQMLPPDAEVPARKVYPDEEIERDAAIYKGIISQTGFSSCDLKRITQPVLGVTGGASHPRFAAAAQD